MGKNGLGSGHHQSGRLNRAAVPFRRSYDSDPARANATESTNLTGDLEPRPSECTVRVLYFINQYPAVSHSFIRREIQALESQGLEIIRVALRGDKNNLFDPNDLEEFEKTRFVLKETYSRIVISFIHGLLSNPRGAFRALKLALRHGFRSDRGLLRHIAYFIEACVVADWTKKAEAHHIHAHFGTNSASVAMLAGEIGQIPYSVTMHGPEEFDNPKLLSLSDKIQRSFFVVGVSSFGRSQILRYTRHEEWDKVIIVRCGIDRAFHEAATPPVPDVSRIVCVGRLCEQKGQFLLLDAMRSLLDESTDFELVFGGDGPMRADIERLVERYGLTSRVRITGWISSEEVRNEITRSRALVLPSFAEGLPVVIMEAMALRRPVISTYVAGIPELVIPGETGWLVSPGSIEPLKAAIREVLQTPVTQLQIMGERAKERVLSLHDAGTEASKLIPMFEASRAPKSNRGSPSRCIQP